MAQLSKRIAQLPEQGFPRKSDIFPFTRLVVTFCLLEMLLVLVHSWLGSFHYVWQVCLFNILGCSRERFLVASLSLKSPWLRGS